MPTDLFRKNDAAIRAALASDLGCDPADFATNALTIVPRPAPAREPHTALIAGFGTGTVLSIAEPYLEWAKGAVPAEHYRVNYGVFLFALVEEGRRRNEHFVTRWGGAWFTLSELMPVPELPAGLRYQSLDVVSAEAIHATGLFHNALGELGDGAFRGELFQGGVSVVDPRGEPIAVAAYHLEGPGVLEIGVDVLRSHRGQGLAHAVVISAARMIVDAGYTPMYSAATTNIRSLRTAISSGFLPVASLSAVAREIA